MKRSIILFFCVWLAACKNDSPTPPATQSEKTVDKSSMVELISEEIADAPDNAELYYKRAEVYYNRGEYEQAKTDLHHAIELDSVPYKYYHLLADSYLDNMESKEGLAVMNGVVMLNPKNIPSLLKLAEYQLIFKMYDNSILTLNEILRQDPQNAEAYFMLGLNFEEQGDRERAISSFQTAVEMNSELIDGWYKLAELHEESNPKKAVQYYDNAIIVNPDAPEPYHMKAFYLQNHDKLSEAIGLYKKIIVKNPDYLPAFLNSGILYMEMDSIPQAVNAFNVMTQIKPEDPVGYYFKAQAELLNNDQEAALEAVSVALRINPDYVEANELYKKIQAHEE